MSRKDHRPASDPERAKEGEEISRKASDDSIFDSERNTGETVGGFARGPEPGQFTGAGSPGYQDK